MLLYLFVKLLVLTLFVQLALYLSFGVSRRKRKEKKIPSLSWGENFNYFKSIWHKNHILDLNHHRSSKEKEERIGGKWCCCPFHFRKIPPHFQLKSASTEYLCIYLYRYIYILSVPGEYR